MTPVEASKKTNERKVFSNLYGEDIYDPISKPKFKLGDTVRITKKNTIWDKGYTPRWTEEIFTISQVQHTDPPRIRSPTSTERKYRAASTSKSYKKLARK